MRIVKSFQLIGAVAALVLGASGCSSNPENGPPAVAVIGPEVATSSGDGQPGTDSAAGDAGAGPAGGSAVAPGSGLDPDSGRPFGVDRETLAVALQKATKAAGYQLDGDTIRLTYAEGSVDDVAAAINCGVARQLVGDEDRVVLVYPDGEIDCAADDADVEPSTDDAADGGSGTDSAEPAGSVAAQIQDPAAAGATGSATLTIGDRSWQFATTVCAFGEDEIGVPGSEFNMLAQGDGMMVYAAIDEGYTYIELASMDQDSAQAINLMTNPDPTIVIEGKQISGQGTFISLGDDGPGEPVAGSLTATCA